MSVARSNSGTRNRPNGPIPIPSSFVSSSPPPRDGPTPQMRQQQQKERCAPIGLRCSSSSNATINEQHLQILHQFLSLHLKKTKRSILSVTEFYAIAQKALVQIRMDSTATFSTPTQAVSAEAEAHPPSSAPSSSSFVSSREVRTTPSVDDDWKMITTLTEEERLLYHLLAVTSPELFRLCSVPEHQLHAWTTDSNKQKDILCVEALDLSRASWNELLDTRRRRSIIEDWKLDDKILQAILEHRTTVAAAAADAVPTQRRQHSTKADGEQRQQAALDDFLIRPGMTIDERVRARAGARDRELYQQEQTKRAGPDPEWLVQLADALWTLAHQQKLKQQQMGNPRNSYKITLKDAVLELRSSMRDATHASSRSKREVVEGIVELHRRCPNWINIHKNHIGDGSKNDNQTEVDPLAMLSISSAIHYSTTVRAALTGKHWNGGAAAAVGTRPNKKSGHNPLLNPQQQQRTSTPNDATPWIASSSPPRFTTSLAIRRALDASTSCCYDAAAAVEPKAAKNRPSRKRIATADASPLTTKQEQPKKSKVLRVSPSSDQVTEK
jgi:hypothetical protein